MEVFPPIDVKPLYFGVFNSGPLANDTNPFSHLNETSRDGGVLWMNVEPTDQPLTFVAKKDGKVPEPNRSL